MPQELCPCRSGDHGHEPGKCPNQATEADDLCKACHDDLVAGTAAPFGEAAFGEGPFGPKPPGGL